MIEPTIEKIIIEKTLSGINLEFLLTDSTSQIFTDLDNLVIECENTKSLLKSFSTGFNSNNIPSGEVLKSVSKLLNK